VKAIADTHVVLWWLSNDARLSPRLRALLGDAENEILWSMASSFEVAVKLAVGKLALPESASAFFSSLLNEDGFRLLPIENGHCARLAALPLHHRDPFDRMLVAQAQEEGVPLLSADAKLAMYDVEIFS